MNWDERYKDGDTPWDKGAPAPSLIEVMERGCFPAGAEVLVPGCGLGHDVGVLAEAGYLTTGFDISAHAIQGAQNLTQHRGASFLVGDLFDPSFQTEKQYDGIWEHTCYCAILPGQREDYAQAVSRLLKPGGVLMGVFFNTENDREGPPFMTNRQELHRVFSKHFTLEWECAPREFFPTREGIEWLMCWRNGMGG